MKVNTRRHSARVTGKATAVKKNKTGVQKAKIGRSKLKLKNTSRVTSLVNLVSDVKNRAREKKKADKTLSQEIVSSECISIPPCSTETAVDEVQISRVPLVIDSPVHASGRPAFSLASLNFEVCDAKVVLPRGVHKVKQMKRKRSAAHVTFQEVVSDEEEKDIQLFPVREWGLVVAVLPHPKTIRFLGPALIQVISGSVNILGYVLEEFHGIVPAFSFSSVMCLDVKTETCENICRQASRLQIVKEALLANKVPDATADKILNSCDNSSVIVGFRKNFRSTDVHFVNSLMPNAFPSPSKTKKKNDFMKEFGFKINVENSLSLQFLSCKKFIVDLLSSIKDSAEKNAPAPRVVVQGMKNVGKSTFLRYIINRVLNVFDSVYYLDADPGQSEFTPAGCVSLVKVTAPLLGAPFTHQTTPEKMYFLGTASIQDATEKYPLCVKLLSDYYMENCFNVPLFVNPMGWMTGVGLNLLTELKSCVVPTHIVKIMDDQPKSGHSKNKMPAEPTNSFAKEFIYEKFAPDSKLKELINPAERRDLSMLAYLGKCQKLYSSVCSFNSIVPYRILWKDVALCVGDLKYANEHIMYAFNGAWVALLSVDDSLIMDCDNPLLPKLMTAEPVGQECYGFGVIRAIDIVKRAFYVTTPEPLDRLKKVNALMKGNVQLPSVLYTKQVCKRSIPYITQVIGGSSIASKHVPRRKFRPNKSETEDE